MYPPSRAKGRREQSQTRRSSLRFSKLSSRQPTFSQSAKLEGQIERYKSNELASLIASSASLIWNIQVLGTKTVLQQTVGNLGRKLSYFETIEKRIMSFRDAEREGPRLTKHGAVAFETIVQPSDGSIAKTLVGRNQS